MSGSTSRRNCSTLAIRKRTELLFQETIFTPVHLGGGGEGGKVRADLGAVRATRLPVALSLSRAAVPELHAGGNVPFDRLRANGRGGASWVKPMTSDGLCPPAALGQVLRQGGASRPTQKGPRSGGMERGPT